MAGHDENGRGETRDGILDGVSRETSRTRTVIGMHGERIHALDGLRGVAVLLVLAFHARFTGFGGGFLGVSLFFTISGYLITTLLLAEHERSGSIDLRGFWLRRARRLLPAATATVAVLALIGKARAYDTFGALLYHSNWQQIWNQQEYALLFETEPVLLHFWSLSIEEQFYLLWPLLLWFAMRRAGTVRGAGLAAGMVLVVSILGYIANGGDTIRTYYGSDTRAGEIAVGALLALYLHQRGSTNRWLGYAASLSITGMLILAVVGTTTDGWVVHGGLLGYAVLSAVGIAGCLTGGKYAAILAWRPLRIVGMLSYGLYLYHWPIFLAVGVETNIERAVALFATFAVAGVSYYLLERPIRSGAVRTTIFIPAALALSGALIGVFGWGGWVNGERGEECFYGNACAPTGTKAFDATDSGPKILVIGDSVAQVTTWGMRQQPAVRDGEVALVGMGAGGCPMYGSSYRWTERGETSWTQYCDLNAMLAAVHEWRPDIVIVMFTLSNQADVLLDGAWTSIGEQRGVEAFEQSAASILRAAENVGAAVWWSTSPESREGNSTFDGAAGRVSAHNEAIEALYAAHPAVRRLDLAERYAALPDEAFSDGVHLHKTWATEEGATLLRLVLDK